MITPANALCHEDDYVALYGCVGPLSLFYSNASVDAVEEILLVPRSRSHARLRRNATMSHAFSATLKRYLEGVLRRYIWHKLIRGELCHAWHRYVAWRFRWAIWRKVKKDLMYICREYCQRILCLVLALAKLSSQEENEEKIVLVTPVLGANRNAKVAETAKDFPLLMLLSKKNTAELENVGEMVNSKPIYVQIVLKDFLEPLVVKVANEDFFPKLLLAR
ncbi:hypothetical protein EVAR_68219_1 [Eumeta japonica]|uniref:Uncharacterized protein n=1 Tax=Eumeta variegata TaxID=151549 RepID=A0A4C1ZX20_EUMVA|nr:hypothetical protein EVAR_68219_1 [Eumeta japonica]